MTDLTTRRGGALIDVTIEDNWQVMELHVPLRNLLGYSTFARSNTKGNASFTMEFYGYGTVDSQSANKILKERGVFFEEDDIFD